MKTWLLLHAILCCFSTKLIAEVDDFSYKGKWLIYGNPLRLYQVAKELPRRRLALDYQERKTISLTKVLNYFETVALNREGTVDPNGCYTKGIKVLYKDLRYYSGEVLRLFKSGHIQIDLRSDRKYYEILKIGESTIYPEISYTEFNENYPSDAMFYDQQKVLVKGPVKSISPTSLNGHQSGKVVAAYANGLLEIKINEGQSTRTLFKRPKDLIFQSVEILGPPIGESINIDSLIGNFSNVEVIDYFFDSHTEQFFVEVRTTFGNLRVFPIGL